ncbi:MAG: CCA tRNA nucleotidyltransferase [Bacteriovoracaceae bacterium]|nr:CCA tRNA nucleotidyltransferase [Bacteriovoracaceae bacterium]
MKDLTAIDLLRAISFKPRVLIVGGAVRDKLLQRSCKDIDLIVEKKNGSRQVANQVYEFFPKQCSKPFNAGKTYPVWKLRFKDDVEFDGIRYKCHGVELDISDTQSEAHIFASLEEDIKRRDFTINMLVLELRTNQILDPSTKALSDLKQKFLDSHPEVSPEEMLKSDPARILRLYRFSAVFDFSISTGLLKKAQELAPLIKEISSERIRDEIIKVSNAGRLSDFISLCKDNGVLPHFLPEIQSLSSQIQEGSDHSLFTHTLRTIENSPSNLKIQLAALMHALPSSQIQKTLHRLKFDNKLIASVCKVIRNYLRPLESKDWPIRTVRMFIRDIGEELEMCLELCEAYILSDQKQREGLIENPIPALREKITRAKRVPIIQGPLIDGREIMHELGIGPGRRVGTLMTKLIEWEDEQVENNITITREDALTYLKSLL